MRRVDVHELAVLLEGIEVDELKTKPRWEPTPAFALDAGLTIAHIDRVRASHLLHLISPQSAAEDHVKNCVVQAPQR